MASVVCRRSLSGFITLLAAGPAGRVGDGRPTLYVGPVRLRPVRATPCSVLLLSISISFHAGIINNFLINC